MAQQTNPYPMVHPDTFRANTLIDRLKDDPYWTVSDDRKRPVDAKQLLADGTVDMASLDSDISPLVTLTALDADKNLEAVNRAYRLRARENRVIAIDVEPHAPIDMKQQVMQFPAHYTELSRNGGVHLFIQVPEALITDDNRYMFDELSVFKEPVPKGVQREAYYEVIFNDHYITFTKRMDTQKPDADFEASEDARGMLKAFLENIAQLDKERQIQREKIKQFKVDMAEGKHLTEQKKKDIEMFIELRALDAPKLRAGEMQPEDYGDDMSRYEIAVASSIASHVKKTHNMTKDTISFKAMAHRLKDQDLIYATYKIIQDILPYRDKHDEFREELPWLMYVSKNAYEFIRSKEAEKRKTNQR